MFCFFSIFFFAGGAALWFLTIWPYVKYFRASDWVETSCVIREISVKSHDSSDGDTYSPSVRFEYTFDGQGFVGSSFWFGDVSTNYRSAIAEAVKPFQVGGEYKCYVNPRAPAESVLNKRVCVGTWFGAILGSIFSGVGLVGMIFGARSSVKPKSVNASKSLPSLSNRSPILQSVADEPGLKYVQSQVVPVEAPGEDQPLVLKEETSRMTRAVGIWFAAAFWNAITWTITVFAARDGGIFTMLFMGIFIVIGLGLVAGAVYTTMQIFNPRIAVICSQTNLFPGCEFEVSWVVKGKVESIKELLITVEGAEVATYRQGTDTRTETKIFYKNEVVKLTDASQIAQGFQLTSLPVDTMHSFEGSKNKIQWRIKVSGAIGFWPDVQDNFPINVFPPVIGTVGTGSIGTDAAPDVFPTTSTS